MDDKCQKVGILKNKYHSTLKKYQCHDKENIHNNLQELPTTNAVSES
jgi:hypothetical protein